MPNSSTRAQNPTARRLILTLLFATEVVISGGRSAESDEKSIPESVRFLMDKDFAAMSGHAWRVETGIPEGQWPLIKQDMPWDSGAAGCGDKVIFDQETGVWKAWYACTPAGKGWFDSSLAYAESADGLTWTKPELNITDWQGERRNNLLLTVAEVGGGLCYPSVIKYPNAEGLDRWEMFIMVVNPGREGRRVTDALRLPDGLGKHPSIGLYRFRSADGLRWVISHDGKPVMWKATGAAHDRWFTDVALVQRSSDGTYHMFRKTQPGLQLRSRRVGDIHSNKRVPALSLSRDGIDWTAPRDIIAADDPRDPDDLGVIEVSVTLGAGRHLAVMSQMHSSEARVNLGFAAGTDSPEPWFRPGRQPCLQNPPLGEIGGGQLRVSSQVVRNGKLYVYFGAFDSLHGNPENLANRKHPIDWNYFGGLSRASWDADRLWAIGPNGGGTTIACVTTIPQRGIAGRELPVNARVIGNGSLAAELVDGAGNVIKGYSLSECVALTKDEHEHPLRWKAGHIAPTNAVQVRFVLHRAWLYSFHWR